MFIEAWLKIEIIYFFRKIKVQEDIEGICLSKPKILYVFVSSDPNVRVERLQVSINENLAGKNNKLSETSVRMNELRKKTIDTKDEILSLSTP